MDCDLCDVYKEDDCHNLVTKGEDSLGYDPVRADVNYGQNLIITDYSL
jgi:hypothetical protein